MKKNLIILFVIAPLFGLFLVGVRIYFALNSNYYSGPDTYFEIHPGEGFAKINSRLADQKIISSARLFHRYNQYFKSMEKYKAGRYMIKSQSNMIQVYQALLNSKSLDHYVTIPEGKNIFEIAKILEEKGLVQASQFIEVVRDPKFLSEQGISAQTAEGYLYPETYNFLPGSDSKAIAKIMISEFHKKIKPIDFSTTKLSPREVLILASIVEKETGDKNERNMIAGVFMNRLNIKMRLQSDPTTIYGIYENYKGNITKKDLLTPSDYNTYTLSGLPKGPISNPGIESIKAVLNPTKHKFLYFVSQNEGTHSFSENYGDHQKAVDTFQKNAKNREGKSWRDLNKKN